MELPKVTGKIDIESVRAPKKHNSYPCKECKYSRVHSKGETCDYCLEDTYLESINNNCISINN